LGKFDQSWVNFGEN